MLRDYQQAGIDFVFDRYSKRKEGSILAFDPGLGKTLTALMIHKEFLRRKKIKRTLIIAPAYLIQTTWIGEVKKWLGHDVFVYTTKREKPKKIPELVIASYGMLSKDKFYEDLIFDFEDHLLIADEAHENLQNYDSNRSKEFRQLCPIHTLLLTGTPVNNKLEDLYGLIRIADRNLAGQKTEWENKFLIFRDHVRYHKGKRYEEPVITGYKNAKALYKMFREVALVKYKKDTGIELPAKKIYRVPYRLQAQRQQYIDYLEWSEGRRTEVLQTYCKLTNVLSGLDSGNFSTSDKYFRLWDILHKLGAHKKVIWCYRVESAKELQKNLSEVVKTFICTGNETTVKRSKTVVEFLESREPCILVATIQSLGTGVNMPDIPFHVFWELPLTASEFNQAIDRSHRLNSTKPLHIFVLYGKGTQEEQIYRMIQNKEKLTKAGIDGKTYLIKQSMSFGFNQDVGML